MSLCAIEGKMTDENSNFLATRRNRSYVAKQKIGRFPVILVADRE